MLYIKQNQEKWLAILFFLLVVVLTGADDPLCKLRGKPEYPQLSKEGDIIIGGILPFHSSWKDRELSYTDTPQPLKCTK